MRYDNNRRDNRTAFTWRLFIMRYTVRTITKKKKRTIVRISLKIFVAMIHRSLRSALKRILPDEVFSNVI